MTALIYVFLISLGLGLSLIAHKLFEIKRGRKTPVSELFMLLDKPAKKFFDSSRNFLINRRERIILFFRREIPAHTATAGERLGRFLGDKYKGLLRKIRGEKSLENGNGGSMFMRTMTDHKKRNGNGGSISEMPEDEL
jgi:hypothetical protein